MAYFRNNTVNLLNLHYGIHALAMSGGGAFYTVYLLRAGVKLPYVLAVFALIVFGRFAIRPLIVPLAVRFGLKPLVIAGTIIAAMQYPLLAQVHGIGPMLFAVCLFSSLGDVFYWPNYHAYFATLGDREHRGHQISAREGLAAIVGIVAPIATGWMLVSFGAAAAFGATAALQTLAALPLFWTPDVAVARRAPGAWKAAIPGIVLFMADGWIAAGNVVVWQLALFLSLSESYVAYGGALAIAALAGAVAGLVLGRHIDAGHGRRATFIACTVFAGIILLRAASPGHAALAVVANAMGAFGTCLYAPALMTAVYNLAKRAPCTLRFHIATEGGWDVGMAVSCLIAAALTGAGVSLSVSLLLSLLGVAAICALLSRYYTRNAATIEAVEAA